MQIEQLEIRDHLSRHAPFDELPDDILDAVASQVQVRYFKAGTSILESGETIHDLHYIRSGAVEIFFRSGKLFNRLSEGDIFGQASLRRQKQVRFPARALEDSLIYFIPEDVFEHLCATCDNFADYVDTEGSGRLKAVVEPQGRISELMKVRINKLISRPPVMLDAQNTIHRAAAVMTEESVSALLITRTAPEDDQPRVTGIITDRDFRTRVVSEALPPETPLYEIMSPDPVTLQHTDSVLEAVLCMLRHNIHHLPVLNRRRPVGLINLADVLQYQSRNSLYLVNDIFKRRSISALQSLVPDVRATFVRMVEDEASAHMIGSAMSSIGRSFILQLLELAEEEFGPPPVPYCFMVMGSMAREEQLIVTDQDNALVLDDSFNPEQHDEYFLKLAKFVSDGLAACGYTYCKGDIMATNPRWRQPLSVWKKYFTDWIERPNAQALLNSNIFFDLEAVGGQSDFVEQLRELIAERASRNKRFLAMMARNSLSRTPPLGFFRTFVMETDGQQRNIINIKGRGTAPLTDLIRVHALACGSTAQSSFDRLDDIAKTRLMPPESLQKLRYALEFLSLARIRHQALDIQEGREPNNYIEPENVSSTERHGLKDAFQILSNAQNFLRYRYPLSANGQRA
ncbi:MAG: cyclic nucleotide-binding/CBS domain-containing protein [Alcaligenaceae bacterium]|nr:cyclic nucleotide-binding/CBS domain-containing protein [Alcaligenaceae bacterium]